MRMLRIACVALPALLAGCTEMMMVRPELQSDAAGRKVEVKAKVMAVGMLDYSPDGKRLASGGADPTVRFWDMVNAKGLRGATIPAKYGIADVVYSADGKLVAASGMTGLFGGSITRVWDAETGREVAAVPGEAFGFRLAFSADNRYLFGNELDLGGLMSGPFKIAKQFDLQTGAVVRTFHKSEVGERSPDGKTLLLRGDGRPGLALVDVQSGRELWRTGDGYATGVAFAPDGRHLIAAYAHYRGTFGTTATITVALLDAATGSRVRELVRYDVEGTFLAHEKDFQQLRALAVSPDGRYFVGGNDRGEYRLWDMANGQLIRQLRRPDEKIVLDMSPAHVAFSPNGRLIAVTYAASVRLYYAESGEEAAAMIAFDDGEWLVTTPSGYYNASEKGDEYLSVAVGGQPYSVAQLREAFFRPDLVKLALAGGVLGEFRKVADVKPPPAVSIVEAPATTRSGRIALILNVADQGGGVGDVRLYRNGTAVVLDGVREAAARGEKRSFRYEIALEPGKNAIRAIAFNADNSMQSTDALADIQAEIAPRVPALHAVVVGIKDFANPRLALKYAVADADLFATTLENRGKGLYASVNVRRLTKPAETTNAAIVAALRQARSEVGPDDLFVFYVASHGTVDDGQYMLITSNVGSTSTARLKQDALTQDALKDLLSNIPASKKLIVLDTCSAGQLGDALQVAMLTRGMSDDTAMKVLSRAVGSTILSAATSVQEALEGYKDHGLFTYVVVEGLNGAADANRDGYVRTLELADYVDIQVPELAEKVFKHKQYPIVSPTGQGFPLVKVR